jgi:hypothetical protein
MLVIGMMDARRWRRYSDVRATMNNWEKNNRGGRKNREKTDVKISH